MSSLDIAALTAEASRLIEGARVGNIYVVGDLIILKLKTRTPFPEMILEPSRRINLTARRIRPEKPSPVAMLLRKHLRDRRLVGIRQYGFDRVVELVFEPGGLRLVVEILPRGVAALLDGDGRVIYATRYAEMRDRTIKRGEKYSPPPLRALDPRERGPEELLERIREGKDLVRGLIRGAGWPPELAEEVIHRLGLDKSRSPLSISLGEAEALLSEARNILEKSMERPEPVIIYHGSEPLLVAPFIPSYIKGDTRRFRYFSEALDEYFSRMLGEESGEEARLLASMERARRLAEKYLEEARTLEEKANLAAANIVSLEEALECASRIRKAEGWKAIPRKCRGIVSVEPSKGIVKILVGGLEIELDMRLTAEANVLAMYRRAGELRAKARKAEEAVKNAEKRLEEMRARRMVKDLRERLASRPREWFERYHWLISSEGFLVIGGRNADQNESVVKRYLGDRDIFMHAEIHGAPVVIIKTNGETPGEKTLREAACLAACYSRAWRAGIGAVDVYWAWGDQVSKSPPPGEYISKGAFMVYGRRNYIRGVKLELALGIEELDDYARVIVGPEELVSSRTRLYVVIAPGDLRVSELIAELKKALKRRHPDKQVLIEAFPEQDIAERIPGPSRIVRIG